MDTVVVDTVREKDLEEEGSRRFRLVLVLVYIMIKRGREVERE